VPHAVHHPVAYLGRWLVIGRGEIRTEFLEKGQI
jgi:hypothetical protein